METTEPKRTLHLFLNEGRWFVAVSTDVSSVNVRLDAKTKQEAKAEVLARFDAKPQEILYAQ